jgi:hypothetical protein
MSPDAKTVCWCEAGSLHEGDLIATPAFALEPAPISELVRIAKVDDVNAVIDGKRSDAFKTPIKPWMFADAGFWRLVGYWLAEGSVAESSSSVSFAFGKGEETLVSEVEDAVNRLFNVKLWRQSRELEVGFTSFVFGEFMRMWFRRDGKKVLPWWIDMVTVDCLKEMLRCLFLGDGNIRGFGATLGNGSLELLSAVQRLLLRIEIQTSLTLMQEEKMCHVIKGRQCRTRPVYGLSGGKLMTDFLFKGVLHRRPVASGRRGSGVGRGSGPKTGLIFSGGYALLPLRSIERRSYDGEVYNMSVEDDESYCSRLLAVHNCYDPWRYCEMGEAVTPAEHTTLSEEAWYLVIEKARFGKPGILGFRFERPYLRLVDPNVVMTKGEEF